MHVPLEVFQDLRLRPAELRQTTASRSKRLEEMDTLIQIAQEGAALLPRSPISRLALYMLPARNPSTMDGTIQLGMGSRKGFL